MTSRRFPFPQLFVIIIALLTVRALQLHSPLFADFISHSASCANDQEQDFIGNTSEVLSVAFSPTGRYALTGNNAWTARMWNFDETVMGCVTSHVSHAQ